MKRFDHLVLDDPNLIKTDQVMLELGAHNYQQIIPPGLFKPDNGNVVAQNTAL
ncbi:unnamed protein product, partial [Ceratitis capitata]